MEPRIRSYGQSDAAAWDRFVRGHPRGTPYHLTAWSRALERVFGYEARSLIAEDDRGIRGVLPLFRVRHLLAGRALVSTPFGMHGGVRAADSEAAQFLTRAAADLARKERVRMLELRDPSPESDSGFQVRQLHATFDLELPSDPEEIVFRLSRNARNMIRKGVKNGLASTVGVSQLSDLHDIYARSVRDLGSPVFPLGWFEVLVEEFGSDVEIALVRDAGRPVGGVMSFRFGETILPHYGGSIRSARDLATNHFMYWDVMKRAVLAGLSRFDFGRSRVGTGAHAFKQHWGMEEHPLRYAFLPISGGTVPDLTPGNTGLGPAITAWRRMPLGLTKLIGPRLVRFFP